MHKIVKIILLSLLCSVNIKAQNTKSSEASTLFVEGKYSAAQALFQKLIIDNGADQNAHYHNAKCSKELFSADAIFLYEKFLLDFPFTSFKDEVNEDLALLYYRELDYSKAINYFLQLKNIEEFPYLTFKLAYAYFSIDSLVDAQYYFSKLVNIESKYAATSQYYSAYIAYKNGLYKTALNGFENLIEDKQFGAITPYYITQIYFFQQNYKQLIAFASPLVDGVIPSRKAEVNRLLAEAYYRTEDYENAIVHFNAYIQQDEQVSPIVHFLLGQSYFKVKQFENAINSLEKVSNTVDSIAQHAAYSLGASYLEVEQFNYALQAFKKSATYTYNLNLQEDAFYNYAKLSYQLDLPFDNTLLVLKTYLEKYDNTLHKKEIEGLMVKTFQSSSKYDEAFDALKDIHLPSNEQQRSLQQLAFFLGVKEYNKTNYNEALSYFQLATQYPEDDKIAYVNSFWLADCFYQLNSFEKSVEVYASLPIINTPDLLIYDKLKQWLS